MWVIDRGSGYVFFNNDRVGQLGTSEILVFQFLSENLDALKSKNEILDYAWPQKVVAPNSLTVAIKNIRKVFSARPCSIEIKTHHGRGYSLHGDINEVALVEQRHDGLDEKIERGDLNIEPLSPSIVNSTTSQENVSAKFTNLASVVKKMVGISLCIMLASAAALVWGYNKKIYCEEIVSSVIACGTRSLNENHKVQLKKQVEEQVASHEERYTRYVYGYNYSPKNLVFYPVM